MARQLYTLARFLTQDLHDSLNMISVKSVRHLARFSCMGSGAP
jgi:hypothetical protein